MVRFAAPEYAGDRTCKSWLEACFLQLAADKVVAVRGSAIPCLASLGTRAAIAALVEMTCSDLVCKVRFEALKALSFLKAGSSISVTSGDSCFEHLCA